MTIKRQRAAWFREHPYCYYCGCALVLPAYTRTMKAVPANAATIEHLRPRGDPRRHEPNRFHLWRRVLACLACNGEQDRKFMAGRSLEERWRRAGHWPRMAMQTGALPGEVGA